MRSPSPTVATVAAYGLPGARVEPPQEPMGTRHWQALLAEVRTQHVTGFLAKAIADGSFPVTPEQRAEVSEAHGREMRVAVLVESTLFETLPHLRSAGIDHRVLKGPAVAHLVYPDASMRSFVDLDLLVPAHQFEATAAMLSRLGRDRRYPEPRRGFDRRFSKGAAFTTVHGLAIDLHRTFVSGPFGLTVDLDQLFATSSVFEIAGQECLGLGREERFVHACFHVALGDRNPRLVPQRDVAQILLTTELDLGRVRELARQWRAEVVVARAVSLTWTTFGLPYDTELAVWAAAYASDRREKRWMRAYDENHGSWSSESLVALEAVPGLWAKGAYVCALVLPERSYVRRRGDRGHLERWRRGLRLLRRGVDDEKGAQV